jgi:hypothetical protein
MESNIHPHMPPSARTRHTIVIHQTLVAPARPLLHSFGSSALFPPSVTGAAAGLSSPPPGGGTDDAPEPIICD